MCYLQVTGKTGREHTGTTSSQCLLFTLNYWAVYFFFFGILNDIYGIW